MGVVCRCSGELCCRDCVSVCQEVILRKMDVRCGEMTVTMDDICM